MTFSKDLPQSLRTSDVHIWVIQSCNKNAFLGLHIMRKGIIMLLQKGFQPIFGGGIVALILREEQESTLELSWCLLCTMWPNSSFMKFHLKTNFKIHKM